MLLIQKATNIVAETKNIKSKLKRVIAFLELDESPPSPIDNSLEPYADEPLADEEWIANYKKEKEEKDQLENELNQHLENAVRCPRLVS